MLAPDWSWTMAIPIVLAIVVVLWVPGAAVAAALGAGRWPSVALAPLMTAGLVGGGGVLTDLLGVPWGLPAVVFWLLVVPAVVVAARWLVVRSGRRPWTFSAPTVRWWEVAVGLGVSVVTAVWVFDAATGQPGNIPQQSDVIFHLGMVRFMEDTASISSLTAGSFNYPEQPVFYPATFHGLSAVVVMLTGAPIVVVENSMLLVTAALVYPIGMMLLVNTLIARDRLLVVLTGLLVLAFAGYPWRIIVWGGLWGQTFGCAFVPMVLAIYGWGLTQVFRGRNWGSAALLFLVAVPAAALAHTSVVFASVAGALLLSVAFSLAYALEQRRLRLARRPARVGRYWLPFVGFTVLAVLVPVSGSFVAPAGMVREVADKDLSPVLSVIGVATFWHTDRADDTQFGLAALFLLVVVGAAVCLRRPACWWLPATAAILAAAVAFLEIDGSHLVWWLTWPWYTWAFRVQAVVDIYAAVLAIVAASALLHLAWGLRRTRGWARHLAVPAVALLLVGLSVLAVNRAHSNIRLLGTWYLRHDVMNRLTAEQARALVEVSAALPDDAVVAENPWRGGQFLYLLGPEHTAVSTDKMGGEDIDTIGAGLDEMRDNPAICSAAQRLGVTHVLTGGQLSNGGDAVAARWAGIDDVSEQEGFRPVVQAGPYTAWVVPDCPS